MLNDSASGKGAKCAIARRTIARPTRAGAGAALDRVSQAKGMRNASHGEDIGQIAEAV